MQSDVIMTNEPIFEIDGAIEEVEKNFEGFDFFSSLMDGLTEALAFEKLNKYEVILYWSEEDDAFVAEVPELAGCIADGETRFDAIKNVEHAIAEWIETAHELGREIPEPKGRLIRA